MPPKIIKKTFEWRENTDRPNPISTTTERNYRASLNKLANTINVDTIVKLLEDPDTVILEIEKLSNHNQKVQTYAAIMYELGIGKKKNGTFSKLTEKTLKYYNSYQKTKVDKNGNPHSQKIFESYEEYLESYEVYEAALQD